LNIERKSKKEILKAFGRKRKKLEKKTLMFVKRRREMWREREREREKRGERRIRNVKINSKGLIIWANIRK
jgi:hypothetical protein